MTLRPGQQGAHGRLILPTLPIPPILPILLAVFLLAACAAGGPSPAPRIDRLPQTESVSGGASAPSFTVDEIVAMVRSGATAEAVVARWREGGARQRFDADTIVSLHGRGVPVPLLNALLAAQEQALRTEYDSRLAAQLARSSAELAAERARIPSCPAPPYWGWGPRPYGGWSSSGGWGGGLMFGW